jgi:protoporphyrinogen oxidase
MKIAFCFCFPHLLLSSAVLCSPSYLIVGAGPVGLWTAIKLKLQTPEADILVLEKRPEYTRNAVFRIDKDSFSFSIRPKTMA